MSNKKILVVVEAPGKIKKFKSILGSKYDVVATVGHIMDLNSKNISVDVHNGFEPLYTSDSKQKKVIKEIKMKAKTASDILIATDKDREGEMIAWSVAILLKIDNPKRILFDSITKSALMKAVASPTTVDLKMVDAQKARRVLDRLVGYEISPILWKSTGQFNLSAGRVQTVIVRLIVDKESDIQNFVSTSPTFGIVGNLNIDGKQYTSHLYNSKTDNIVQLATKEETKLFMEKCASSEFKIVSVEDKIVIRKPQPPFTTSSMQQEASRKLNSSVVNTMRSAQQLYEQGKITYIRTDSVSISDDAHPDLKKFIEEVYGVDYYKKTVYSLGAKHTQDAHEAIRPTDPQHLEQTSPLYELIRKRTVASQMAPAKILVRTVKISVSGDDRYYFMFKTEYVIFSGYTAVYGGEVSTDTQSFELGECNMISVVGTQQYKKSPSRYSESSLLSILDEKHLNIGRPATNATNITKIQDKGYVCKQDIEGVTKDIIKLTWIKGSTEIDETKSSTKVGSEVKKFVPTELGKTVTQFMVDNFSTITDYKFTAKMENNLDKIASGEHNRINVVKEFYDQFHPKVEQMLKIQVVKKDERVLGEHPEHKLPITATVDRFGKHVVKMNTTDGTRYGTIMKPKTTETVTLEDAVEIFEYPKNIGIYNDKTVLLKKGVHGLYISYDGTNYTVSQPIKTVEDCVKILNSKKVLAKFTSGKQVYTVIDGKYGVYINVSNKKNVKVPKNIKVEDLTLEKIKQLIKKK